MIEPQDGIYHRIVTGILVRGDRVLLGRRTPVREWFPSVWDFPGGHGKEGETDDVALVRELQEELGVTVRVPPETKVHLLSSSEFEMRIWVIENWEGEPSNRSPEEHSEIGWFLGLEALQLDLAHSEYLEIISEAIRQD